ncbi:MAG: YqgE/AlgH family protein [Bacteroidetes bacterium]|nr:MAG: YqgE/AlgH family protein [Bacteroidota bacterium]
MKKILDISFENQLAPKKGRILISDPFSEDMYFGRSVVYLCEHSEKGSFGFVLNNYADVELKSLNQDFPDMKSVISIGGPVEKDSMYFIHTLENKLEDDLVIDQGIYVGGDFQKLYEIIQPEHLAKHQIRFFLGYSGWEAGQLEEEIKNNAWVVAEVDSAEEVMNVDIEDPWKYFLQKLGKKYEIISEFPVDPREN